VQKVSQLHNFFFHPFFAGQWNIYAYNANSNIHLFGTSQGSGLAILTFLRSFHPQTQSLWLMDIVHHHLAIAIVFIIAGHMYRTNFGIGHSINYYFYSVSKLLFQK
jgi:photosystem I P700 chlorophyll a apoprotein A2